MKARRQKFDALPPPRAELAVRKRKIHAASDKVLAALDPLTFSERIQALVGVLAALVVGEYPDQALSLINAVNTQRENRARKAVRR